MRCVSRSLVVVVLIQVAVFFYVLKDLSKTTGDEVKCRPKRATTLSGPRLAVIVPFRERFNELLEFLPHMNRFLNDQRINHSFFVINQVDGYRFNRAALINVGFVLTRNQSDYFAMHDVDLLPLNPAVSPLHWQLASFSLCFPAEQLDYSIPAASGIVHLAAPEYHPLYHYERFVGGIVLVRNEQYERINGMSNRYWGWGLEDDEFFTRIQHSHLDIFRPTRLNTSSLDTFRHLHDSSRARDFKRLKNQREVSRKRDTTGGLSNLKFTIKSWRKLEVDHVEATIFNVELFCNTTATPFCLPPAS